MSNANSQVSARIHPDTKDELERIAYEQSSPGNRVHCSELVREAIDEYIERYGEEENEQQSKRFTE